MPRLAWLFIGAAVVLWGVVAASFLGAPVNWHLLLIAGPGGGASLVLAGVKCLLDRLPERDADADKDALTYALRDVILRRGLAVTRPLKRVV